MTNIQKDSLFILIKSLSKSEKRQFKLYVGRLGVNTDSKFLSLFNLLEKMNAYDEPTILNSNIVKKQQLSNLKAHLYKQILVSLRLNPIHHNSRFQIREQLDFATILYHKGLYKQSLKLLDKAKSLAFESQENMMANEIVEFEKIIESQYITRSVQSRSDQLVAEASLLNDKNILTSQLSNLSIQLYNTILRSGYVRNDDEYRKITQYFFERLPKYDITELNFREKLWIYKAHLWYSILVQDFISSFKYSQKWVELFHNNPKMIAQNPVFYLKGNQYLLESLYFLKYKTKFKATLKRLEEEVARDTFPKNDNVKVLVFMCLHQHRLNFCFLDGIFDKGLEFVPQILKGLKEYSHQIDDHHVMVFYYKIACIYFGLGDFKNCIAYLKKIIENKKLTMREDLMCFARVLSLVAHYEAGMDYHLDVQLRSTFKFLIKMNELQNVQREMIRFLRSLGSLYPSELKDAFKKLYKEFKKYENDPYEKRAFLYLDVLSWLESKINNEPISESIRKKSIELNR
ncbi:MAG: hypothetical protein P8L72_07045 [Flavobacteriaceae bacterium]|nr:hypothetical protein [Flavobacteriaceae bacterium]MDG2315112.1 hypothetical protein [Flavobacteriaceae bacterium]